MCVFKVPVEWCVHNKFELLCLKMLLLQCKMYKDQYETATKTVVEQQTQLDEYAQLQHTISDAHDVQVSSTQSSVSLHDGHCFRAHILETS